MIDDYLIPTITLVVGLLGGGALSWLVAKNVAHRPKLRVSLSEEFHLNPRNLHDSLEFVLDGRGLDNLTVARIRVENRGSRDIVSDPATCNDETHPALMFDSLELLSVEITRQDSSLFNVEVVVEKPNICQLRITRLRAGGSFECRLIGIDIDLYGPRNKYLAGLYKGSMIDVDVAGGGSLRKGYYLSSPPTADKKSWADRASARRETYKTINSAGDT